MIKLRRAWFQIHKWIGLILMIVLIPLSLSGSLLVWHDALDGMVNPRRYAVSGPATLSPSAYAAAARAAVPGARLAGLRWPEGRGPVIASLADSGAVPDRPGPPRRTMVYLDGPSARVLDVAGSNAGLVRFLHAFHGSLSIPGTGRAIVGWLGVVLFLSCLSGLWLWWPITGRWTRGFRWRRAREFDTNLHHQIGFWIVLPLAMLAFTGAWIAWPQMIGGGRGGEGARFRAAPLERPALTPDAALAAAGGRAVALDWPTAKAGWRVSLAGGGSVSVDDATGAATPARGRGDGIMRGVRRWHDGDGMGAFWQVAIFLAGLAPLALGVTGVLMWLRTRRWRRRPALRPVPAE